MIGKDIVKFHAITWPAMLLALGLEVPQNLFVHGFITVEGQKMSKTIGNVVDPIPLVEKYGVDVVRYFLMREITSSEDGDFSFEKLKDRYNSDLANNLGNLVSRVAKLISTKCEGGFIYEEKYFDKAVGEKIAETKKKVAHGMQEFRLNESLSSIWELLAFANAYIDEHKPWAEEHGDHLLTTLTSITILILEATFMIAPFMPETAERIRKVFGIEGNHSDAGTMLKWTIVESSPLFPRL
jgi:methionyl-tRNA synthetase